VNEGIDVALRWGALTDSNVTARRLGASPRLLAASPAYLARAGSPDAPQSLANHEVIVGPLGAGSSWWSFQRDGRTSSVRVEGRLTTSTNQAGTAAAVAGLGIVSIGLWNCRPELASGALVHVLPDWQLKPIELHAVFAAGRAAKPSARAFADYLANALSE
jgi:DNA-binding transcriptional LysR family regulator